DNSLVSDIETAVEKETKKVGQPLAVEVMPLKNFYKAEEYHQDYLDKNPGGYCHINPALMNIAKR
ncbi:MAG: peptide-methionine (S)-S-oxide reductase, partial [Lachnospiraceae bacterium]|nr:peptide-methionine (S)-S-oxide reductase [Lachnospiraceae bacterium]